MSHATRTYSRRDRPVYEPDFDHHYNPSVASDDEHPDGYHFTPGDDRYQVPNQKARPRPFNNPDSFNDRYEPIGRGPPPHLSRSRSNTRSVSTNIFPEEGVAHHRPGSLNPPSRVYRNDNDEIIARLDALTLRTDYLEAENRQLKQRNEKLEAAAETQRAPSSDLRSAASSRGRALRVKRQLSRSRPRGQANRLAEEDDQSDPKPFSELETELATELEHPEAQTFSLGTPTAELPTPELRAARNVLQIQDLVSLTFREVVGVPSTVWPNLTVCRSNDLTGEEYLNPAFEGHVNSQANVHILNKVIKSVNHKLKRLAVEGLNITWEHPVIPEMAKNRIPLIQTDAEVARRNEENQRTNRRRERRVGKAGRRAKGAVIEVFAKKHGVDSKDVKEAIHEQWMSDEASSPEGDTSETAKEVWKTRMAFAAGLGNVSDDRSANTTNILQVLECAWRSGKGRTLFSEMLHELSEIADAFEPAGLKSKRQYVRVGNTGRISQRIAETSPLWKGNGPGRWILDKGQTKMYLKINGNPF
ncbi:hypothetical protein C8J57DRAFT_1245474 [Mycena rebaudengoi]|nr:hypothetical protein C8J57DRAFT_1245474 [Mycena rebaudengoi]